MNLAPLLALALVVASSVIVEGGFGQPFSWSLPAQWIVVEVDLSGSSVPVTIAASGVVHCPDDIRCFAFAMEYYESYPRGSFFGAYSANGSDIPVKVGAMWQDVLTAEVPRPLGDDPPLDVGLSLNRTLTKEARGDWYVLVVLASRPATWDLTVDGQVPRLRSGLTGVVARDAREFDALAQVDARLGVGVDFRSTVEATRGLLGIYIPWQDDQVGEGSYVSPVVTQRCRPVWVNALVVGGGLGVCHGFALHGPPGPWWFHRVSRASLPQVPWLIYLDEIPPR